MQFVNVIPELRRTDKDGKPAQNVGGPSERAASQGPERAASPTPSTGSDGGRKEGEEGKRGGNHVSVCCAESVKRARLTFGWDKHHPTDAPKEGSISCQWCRYTHEKNPAHRKGCNCSECRAPQKVAKLLCVSCKFAFCSMACFCALHACN